MAVRQRENKKANIGNSNNNNNNSSRELRVRDVISMSIANEFIEMENSEKYNMQTHAKHI